MHPVPVPVFFSFFTTVFGGFGALPSDPDHEVDNYPIDQTARLSISEEKCDKEQVSRCCTVLGHKCVHISSLGLSEVR